MAWLAELMPQEMLRGTPFAAVGAAELSILLLLAALAMLAAEIFIPSGGMIIIMALTCLAGSVWSAWKAWYGTSQTIWWTYVGSVMLLIPAAIIGGLYVFPRTRFGRRILLEAPDLDEVTGYAEEQSRLKKLVGETGKTLSLLNPGGLAQVDGERMHCESEGVLVESGEPIRVIGTKGNRLVVRQIDLEELRAMQSEALDRPPETTTPETSETAAADRDAPLDFDVPQG